MGMTAADLSRFLVEHTSQRLHDSEVTVDRFRSSKTTVYVGGEVGRSGAVPCREGLSPLMQPVLIAGGFRESARLESIIFVRAQ
jgi:protein involved in polysaccharide export with SLBB domain